MEMARPPATWTGQVAAPSRPLLGWRVWQVRDRQLRSWVTDSEWQPGENTARCLKRRHPCVRSPAIDCGCGFWGMFSLLRCFNLAQGEPTRPIALGLVLGWGLVALQRGESFRAEHSRALGLFTDLLQAPPSLAAVEQLFQADWWRASRAIGWTPRQSPLDARRVELLEKVAATYAVPLLSLEEAQRTGLLAREGANAGMQREVSDWVGLGAARR